MSDPVVEMFGRALEKALIQENKRLCILVASLTTALDDASERNGLLQRRVAERDRAALIAATQFDAEVRRAEDAHGKAQRWALEVERLQAGLQWVSENIGAHPENIRKVARDALAGKK